MRLNETELSRLAGSQKRRIHDLIAERDEAREVARNLLACLRNARGGDVPPIDPSFHWLEETQAIIESTGDAGEGNR